MKWIEALYIFLELPLNNFILTIYNIIHLSDMKWIDFSKEKIYILILLTVMNQLQIEEL